jgi:hypothetical protein
MLRSHIHGLVEVIVVGCGESRRFRREKMRSELRVERRELCKRCENVFE